MKKAIEVLLAADTKFASGEAAATLKDIKVGARVVINAKKQGDKLLAILVKVGATTPSHKR